MFGRISLMDEAAKISLFSRLGPEPLSRGFTSQILYESLSGRKASIKALLLNQKIIAGMGNIYADEALFRAGILPHTRGENLSLKQIKKLHAVIREVLKEAIHKGGSSISDYMDPKHRRGTFQLSLQVYGREGQPCLRCNTNIEKASVAQRGTHWCPKCQTS